MTSATKQNNGYFFLDGGGEMGTLISNYDWSATSLPDIDQWPSSLKITLANILHSAFPMFLFWGDELTCLYNDAFRASLGTEGRHPSIGKKGRDVWDFTGPLLSTVMQEGKQIYFEDQLVPFFRNGEVKDIYWTFSYSPAFNDHGIISGVLVTCIETTHAVISRKKIEELAARRTAELQKLNASLLEANTYFQNVINVFKEPLQVLEPIMENERIVDFRFKLTNAAYAAYAN